ncbi:hypothetical protein [Nocardioides bruguierae]|uniref:hypothetical protein n=1 Tax=Nocardioides bruguierae TaxID=2945102 RepID=UPI0020221C99|nr:hypothetical protein [Nocardioides bruguierae]MCL8026051.1 hypothetical protein [Nocardioides bruguierae]
MSDAYELNPLLPLPVQVALAVSAVLFVTAICLSVHLRITRTWSTGRMVVALLVTLFVPLVGPLAVTTAGVAEVLRGARGRLGVLSA